MNEEIILHHTTFNIERSVFDELVKVAEEKGGTISGTIRILLKLVSEEMKHRKMPRRPVKYQQLPEQGEWHTFHIRLTVQEYEHFVDMRKFFKKSVSLLIAYAVKKYGQLFLDCLQPELGKGRDKYIFPHYSLGYEILSGQQYFTICWGKTERCPEVRGIP